jgi:hypothetical protein
MPPSTPAPPSARTSRLNCGNAGARYCAGTGCAPFRVVVGPSFDPIRFRHRALICRQEQLDRSRPRAGVYANRFQQFDLFPKRTLIVPDPLKVNTHAALTMRVVVATEGLSRYFPALHDSHAWVPSPVCLKKFRICYPLRYDGLLIRRCEASRESRVVRYAMRPGFRR